MAYKQTRAFNQSTAGSTPGACLSNVRHGYGIASKYATAWQAWEHTDQHTGSAPLGVDVPVFFSYGADGHVGVRLANGEFWSDGKAYASIAAYNAAGHTPKYVGWSTSVDGVSVLEAVADPKPALPPSGGRIQLTPTQTRTTYRAGTATVAGQIHVTDNSFIYTVRGYDPKYPGRVLINSASGGGNGVGLALYYLSGARIPGWSQV